MQPELEPLSPSISVFVSQTHRFNTCLLYTSDAADD